MTREKTTKMITDSRKKRGPGRPNLGVWAVRVTLREQDLAIARAIGKGEASRGLREALRIAQEKIESIPEAKRVELAAQAMWNTQADTVEKWMAISDGLRGISLVLETQGAFDSAVLLAGVAIERAKMAAQESWYA